jgi:hypothetical protein
MAIHSATHPHAETSMQGEHMKLPEYLNSSYEGDDLFTGDQLRAAVLAEREACAQILANTDLSGLRDHPLQNWVAGLLFEFIKAIRARGQA